MSKTRVHQILEKRGSLVVPGVYDTLSARIAAQAGTPLACVSGYSVAATSIGEPDFGLMTQTEMTDRARRICMSVDMPILVDADTGYGNPLNVYRTVNELIAAGAAGCFLEDQVWPKKCGHMRGKKVIDSKDYINKIRAANAACDGRDFFIIARTDALAVLGMDDAIARVGQQHPMPTALKPDEAVRKVKQVVHVDGERAKTCSTDLHLQTPCRKGELRP